MFFGLPTVALTISNLSLDKPDERDGARRGDATQALRARFQLGQMLSRADLTDEEFQEAQKKLFRAVARLESAEGE